MRWLNLIFHIQNWWLYILHKIKWVHRDEYTFKLRGGLKALVPNKLFFTFKEVFFRDVYTRYLPKKFPQKPLILDVGANVGYFSLAILQKYPQAKVIAFEPFPTNYQLLEKQMQLNHLNQLILDKRAVFGKSMTLPLSLSLDSGDFTTNATIWNTQQNNSLEVESINLPDIFKAYQLSHIDLLKMDCEGAEYSILYECPKEVLHQIHHIVMEVHQGINPNENIEALHLFLIQQGFKSMMIQGEFIYAYLPL